MSVVIRLEASEDHEAIRHVNCLAFGQDAEARLVDALREGGYVRASLVAEKDEQVVGHILFSDLPIVTDAGTVRALALAPMAVLPECQNQGPDTCFSHLFFTPRSQKSPMVLPSARLPRLRWVARLME
jgi:putative acetyltransferase